MSESDSLLGIHVRYQPEKNDCDNDGKVGAYRSTADTFPRPLEADNYSRPPQEERFPRLPEAGYPTDTFPYPPETVCAKDSLTAVYRTRWYILLVMSLSVVLQNACWAIWGPIAESAKAVFGWNTSLLTVMINCGNAGVLTGLIPAGYIVNKYGLRVSFLLITFCLTLSPTLKAIVFKPVISDILIGLGQFLAGIAGSLAQVCYAKVSETWFPSTERSTATAIAVLSNALGGAAAFLLGPGLVEQPKYNETMQNLTNTSLDSNTTVQTLTNKTNMEDEIRLLNIIELSVGAGLFLMTLIHLPKKPPKPPSLSASLPRENFQHDLTKLLKNINFWRINFLCSISFAVYVNWLGLLDENLHGIGVTQRQAGLFGFYASVASSVGGVVIGRLADRFQRRLKMFQLLLYGTAIVDATWIVCMRNQYIFYSHELFAVGIAVLGVLVFTTFPLNIELGCEIGYPVSAEVVGLGIAITINASAVTFLLVQLIPDIGINWMNWTLIGTLTVPVIFMCTFKERYHRMDVDTYRFA